MQAFPKFVVDVDMGCVCPLGAPDCDCSTRVIPDYDGMQLPPSPPKKRKTVSFACTKEVPKQKTSLMFRLPLRSVPVAPMFAENKALSYYDQMVLNIKRAHFSNKEKEKRLAELKALWNMP